MPALSSASLLNSLANRSVVHALSASSPAANATTDALQVVCAWPVSGQYGPGSRALYYALVAACVLARKTAWLRNACLAAALLFPAVAAIHGIVLAALHVDDAVDMDVFGAFQLCAIGVLAAPVTVRLSRTYFYDPGRNTIFLWTGLILAGLLSLTVEFYRIKTSDCTLDDAGNPISNDKTLFPYGSGQDDGPSCGLTCSIQKGPYSPMRQGAANNIYVVPAPDILTFGTATLLAAACCIPAILSLVSMWTKILEINWKSRFGDGDADELIEGTNGATVGKMRGVNNMVRLLLSVVEIPFFSAAVLAILVVGERNFFSKQVNYQTEQIVSVGQWAPIAGTVFAALGSLYLLLAADVDAAMEEAAPGASSMRHCNCSHHYYDGERRPVSHGRPNVDYSPGSRDARSIDGDAAESPPQASTGSPAMQEVGGGLFVHSVAAPAAAHARYSLSNDSIHTTGRSAAEHGHQVKQSSTDAGGRRKVARTLTSLGNYLSNAAHNWMDDSEFKSGKALDFPEIPGEAQRNSALRQIREQYNQPRDSDGNVTPALRRQHSRAGSFTGSVVSGLGIDSPRSPHSRSPSPAPTTTRRPHSSSFPAERSSSDLEGPTPHPLGGARLPLRRDTLEVPSAAYHGATRNHSTFSTNSGISVPRGQTSPTIVVSSDPDTYSPRHEPGFFNAIASHSAPEPLPPSPAPDSPPPQAPGSPPHP